MSDNWDVRDDKDVPPKMRLEIPMFDSLAFLKYQDLFTNPDPKVGVFAKLAEIAADRTIGEDTKRHRQYLTWRSLQSRIAGKLADANPAYRKMLNKVVNFS